MNKTALLLANIVSFLTILIAGFYYFKPFTPTLAHVHNHAGFQMYVDGVKQDFSNFKYMSFKPCGSEEKELTKEEEQLEKAHLHDGVGDVVHVHREGATWGDLVQNINFQFDKSKDIKGYTDSEIIDDILNREIKDLESVIIVIGEQSNATEYITNRVSPEAITRVENSSELCGAE